MVAPTRIGQFVRHLGTGELGVVVAMWIDPTTEELDTYVAFYGDAMPDPSVGPPSKPYVLRYFAGSLEVIETASDER